jgi:hypothetical protein
MTGGSAEYCYSTCSATGATAGGFVGTATGSISISNSYCTGLVAGSITEGAFAGTLTGTSPTNCQYFEIINERQNVDEKDSTKILPGYHYLTALGSGTYGSITKLDASSSAYQTFSGAPGGNYAHPYDSGLKEYYHDKNDPNKYKYNLETVAQLGATVDANTDFVAAHYGDWPAPEEFIFNAPST